jgi:hypothetical protein
MAEDKDSAPKRNKTTSEILAAANLSAAKVAAHEAAAHDAWFRAEVEQGIKEADDPSTQWVPNEVVNATSAKRRAAWAKKAQAEISIAAMPGARTPGKA